MLRPSAIVPSRIAYAGLLATALTSVASHAQTAPPAAAELRVFDPSLIDTSVDPCDNFYRYSCNGWFKRNPLPADQTSYGRFTELAELNRLQLRQILEQAAAPAAAVTRSANEQKIGDEYASCMDTATHQQAGHCAAPARTRPHCRIEDSRAAPRPACPPALHRRQRVLRHGLQLRLR